MKCLARIADDQHDFRVSSGNCCRVHMLDFEGQAPVIDVAFAAFRAANRHVLTGGKYTCRIARSDDAGNSELARNDGGMSGSSTLIRNNGRNPPHHRFPIGIGVLRHQHFSRLDLLQFAHIASRRERARRRSFPQPLGLTTKGRSGLGLQVIYIWAEA